MSSAGDGPSARVFLRPVGSPLTLAMAALAIGSLVQSGFGRRREQPVLVGPLEPRLASIGL